ncbi:MAG: fumarate hydratase [Alphaproteobacteria bacterium]
MMEANQGSLFDLGKDQTEYRQLSADYVSQLQVGGQSFLQIDTKALALLSKQAFMDINFYLRSGHLKQLSNILEDPEASENDRYVAYDLLKNANIAAGGVLPMCQDTGTAIINAKRGRHIITAGNSDQAMLAQGVLDAYQECNLRYSQLSPLSMYHEVNTKNNLPAQIDIACEGADEYKFLMIAKGGGSANKSFLYQPSPALLEESQMLQFLKEKMISLGTAACPPYHLAVVIGGTSAELTMKTVKLASTRYLDTLPSQGGDQGLAFRDRDLEQKLLEISRQIGIGAQFGGKYFCHDVRVIRLPRHGASLPIGIGVSCSADRQALAKINRDGVFLEQLEQDPAKFMPAVSMENIAQETVKIDLNQPMADILATLSKHPIRTRLSLSGSIIVARDAAHQKLKAQLAKGEPLPDYFKNHPIYYAGPAKKPEGFASGSFGPTTAGRMDGFVDEFQEAGGSMVMLAKGNRSQMVTAACKKHGGFYLGSIGGPGARLAQDCIKKVEVIAYEELGMEAIWRIEVVDFPAFIVIDDKGNDFFAAFTA